MTAIFVWTDGGMLVHWPLINVMYFFLISYVFLGFIDTTNSTKDVNYVPTKVNKNNIVQENPKKVIQMCFYNTTTMKNTIYNISHE
jgi:hypothetical protein